MEKNTEKDAEMLEFEFLDELEDEPEIPDKVNYENEYYEYFKNINEIIRNSEHPKWDIVKATIKEAARDTFEKISFGVTNNRFVNEFKNRWNAMASKGYAFKENTKEGIKAYINMSKYEMFLTKYNRFINREKPKLKIPKISLFEFSLKNTLIDMITDKVIERLDKDTYSFVMNNSNEDVKHTVKGLTKEMMDNGEITIEKQAVDILQSKYNIPESELKDFLERHAVEKVTDEPVKVEVPEAIEASKKDEIYRQGDKYFQNGKEIDDGVFINTVHLNGKHAMDNMFKYTPNLLNELLDTTVDLHSMRDKLDNTELSIMNNIDTFFRSMIDRASLYAYEEGDDIPFDKMKELNGIDFTKTDAAVVYKFLKENSASIVNVISYDESNHIPLNTSAYNRRLCKEAVYKMNDYIKTLDKDNDKNINTVPFKKESFKDKNDRVNQVR
jgi:hypothetical protein